MRVGVLIRGGVDELDWARRLGFASIEWMRFEASPAGVEHKAWKPFAEQFASEAKARGVRIFATGALYRNPLDPRQTGFAQATFRRAIAAAAPIGGNTACSCARRGPYTPAV